HAHAHGIVHRDLKPENVFVIRDPNGAEVIQLVDFGLAKVAEGGSSRQALTQFGQVFGTPAYMSPEQCRAEVVDARTDLDAAGVMLGGRWCGRPPVAGDDRVTLLALQLSAAPPPLPEFVPPSLRAVVDALLAKDRDARMPDAGTAARALTQALTVAPPPRPPSIPGGTMPSMQGPVVAATPVPTPRVPRRWLYAGVAVVGLLVIIAAWPHESSSDDGDGDGDEQPVTAGIGTPTQAWVDKPKPEPQVYVDIDRELSAKNRERAME